MVFVPRQLPIEERALPSKVGPMFHFLLQSYWGGPQCDTIERCWWVVTLADWWWVDVERAIWWVVRMYFCGRWFTWIIHRVRTVQHCHAPDQLVYFGRVTEQAGTV